MPLVDWCVCCECKSFKDLYRGLVLCHDCGHAWYPQVPSRRDLENIYDKAYFVGNEYLDYEMERTGLERNFRKRLNVLKRLHPTGGKLFEVGCSYGYFLKLAAHDFDIAGCDVSEHAVGQAILTVGTVVQKEEYLETSVRDEDVDIVCLWDTIEHLPRPDLVVSRAAQHLKRGGTLALSTGDIGSFVARLRGPRWRLIHPPSHLHYFSQRSLERLLNRNGLEMRLIRRPWIWRNTRAVAYRVLYPKKSSGTKAVYRLLDKVGCLDFCFPFSLGDIVDVYASKY